MKSVISYFVVLLLFAIPTHADDGPQALQEAFLQAIVAGDADAIAALYTPDAVNYTIEGGIAQGRDEIRESWAPFLASNKVRKVAIFDDRHEVHGDMAVAWGLWRMTFVPKSGGEAITMEGRFTDMSKNIDGKWLYVVDHASVPPPPASE